MHSIRSARQNSGSRPFTDLAGSSLTHQENLQDEYDTNSQLERQHQTRHPSRIPQPRPLRPPQPYTRLMEVANALLCINAGVATSISLYKGLNTSIQTTITTMSHLITHLGERLSPKILQNSPCMNFVRQISSRSGAVAGLVVAMELGLITFIGTYLGALLGWALGTIMGTHGTIPSRLMGGIGMMVGMTLGVMSEGRMIGFQIQITASALNEVC